jgi:hypothetical protein
MDVTIITTTGKSTFVNVKKTEVRGELYFIFNDTTAKGFPIRNIIEITERSDTNG